MAKSRDLQAVLNELTTAVQKTEFDLFLHYSNDQDGWQVALGNAERDERWKDAGTPQRLVDTLQDVVTLLNAQFAANAAKSARRARARRRRR
jgi:hypothetical protein